MLKHRFIFFACLTFSLPTLIISGVLCDQLSTLSPGIMRFISHRNGQLIAAQEAGLGATTRLAFYEFQKGNDGGKRPQLTLHSALEQENAQGIVWDWSKTQQNFCIASHSGRFAIYAIPKIEPGDEETDRTPILLGEKTKPKTLKTIRWSNDDDLIAVALDNKLTLYALEFESKKRPIRRMTSIDLSIDEITFLEWSHDNSLIVVGNNKKLVFLKTRTPSGSLKLSLYTSKQLDQALQSVAGSIKDIAWNKKGAPTLAILNKKMTLISFIERGGVPAIGTLHNFASNIAAALAWQNDNKENELENQQLIVASQTARTYQVYTVTPKSLMFDTASHEFLQPYQLPEIGEPGAHKFNEKTTKNHTLTEETMIELINKLASR